MMYECSKVLCQASIRAAVNRNLMVIVRITLVKRFRPDKSASIRRFFGRQLPVQRGIFRSALPVLSGWSAIWKLAGNGVLVP
jgi:hypothetical protein